MSELAHIWRLYYDDRKPFWKCDCSPTMYADKAPKPSGPCRIALAHQRQKERRYG